MWCHTYWLPIQPQSISALWPVLNYISWSQRHTGISKLQVQCPTNDTTTSSRSDVANRAKKSKVILYSIRSIGHGADPGFLAVSLQVTLIINLVVDWHYFPPGLRLLSQPKRSPPWPVPNYIAWWLRHTGVSSLPTATMQWWPARIRTRDMEIVSPTPYQ